jgi:hypothetical protein
MSHSPLLVRILAEVTASQVALPKGQSMTKFQNVSKWSNLVQKSSENDVMSEIIFSSQPKFCLSGYSKLDSTSHVTVGAKLNMRL